MHSCLENWYDHNRIECTATDREGNALPADVVEQAVDIAETIVAADDCVLPPRTGRLLLTEQALVNPPLELAGVPVEGYIDLTDLTDPKRIRLYDFKTRSQFRRSGQSRNLLTPDELTTDVQMCSYAAWAMRKYNVDSVEVSHIYIRTTGRPAAEIVTAVVTQRQADIVLAGIAESVRSMDATAGMQLADIEPNYDACNDFRRPCPFIAQCLANCGRFKPPEQLFEELGTMSLSEKVAAHKAAGRQSNTTNATQPPTGSAQTQTPTSATPAPTAGALTGTAAASEYSTELAVYVDCLPVKGVSGAVVRLEDEIERRTTEILAAVADGSLRIENLSAVAAANIVDLREVKFGCGTTALLGNFKRNPPKGVIVARNTGLSALVLEVLRPLAVLVVEPLG